MLGDHIRALKGGRWVHGIDLGDQRVLHLVEDVRLAPGDRLRRVYKPEFTAGAAQVELVVHRERTYPARAVVARAYSRFMDPTVVAMFRDSEAFAAWCKIGRLPETAPAAAPKKAAPAKAPAPAAPVKPARPAAPKAAPKKAASKPAAGRPAKPAKPAAKAAAKATRKPAPKKAAKKAPPAKRPAAKQKASKAPAKRPATKTKTKARPAAKAARKKARR